MVTIAAMRYREQAICLRTTDYSETSQVVHFLTRGCGVVRLIAKGSKRPKSKTGGAIDLLGEGDLVYSSRGGSGLGTLMEFSETVSRAPLRKDALRLNMALYLIESANAMLAEDDPHPEVFDLLHNALERLAQSDAPLPAVLAYYQWRLLRNVGLLGDLTSCVSCGIVVTAQGLAAGSDLYFTSRQGGLLCADCEGAAVEKFRVDSVVLAGLVAIGAAESGQKAQLSDQQARSVSRMLSYHMCQQLGYPLKMDKYLGI